MENFPHYYKVKGYASQSSDISLSEEGVPDIVSAPPAQFGGPGDKWSPESLLVASVSDCFILSFRAISRASKFYWESVQCTVEGVLDKHDKVVKFTGFKINVLLTVRPDVSHDTANRLLKKAEHLCLITNSLSGETYLSTEIKEISE
ncbi:MAG: OsmC family protein [Candidatus Endonucleobacter sp. (ex Gigantidas childressi)]|nr:OsmC family protein [Candidatus Endonucleobacter sp. (ex Gigantidas childressi)]